MKNIPRNKRSCARGGAGKACSWAAAVLLAAFAFSFSGGETASGQGPTEAFEVVRSGEVNWTTGQVIASGIGGVPEHAVNAAQARAMAERAAMVDAYRNLLEAVKDVRVDSQTVVENLMAANDVVRTTVSGIVRGARTIRTRHLSDGTVEVTVVMPIQGAFLDAVVPQTFGRPLDIKPSKPLPLPRKPPEIRPVPVPPQEPKPVSPAGTSGQTKPSSPEQPAPPPPVSDRPAEPVSPLPAPSLQGQSAVTFKGGTPSGLVIDGRGLGLKPALLPKIVDPAGREIYVGAVATRSNVVEQGAAGYAKDVDAAMNNFRVTDNPVVIRGQRAVGSGGTDIMLAQADADSLRRYSRQGNFLEHCRVIIVY